MWKFRDPYQQRGADYYEEQYRDRIVASLTKRAAAFGYQLVQLQTVTDPVS